jgi:hypothetical protein
MTEAVIGNSILTYHDLLRLRSIPEERESRHSNSVAGEHHAITEVNSADKPEDDQQLDHGEQVASADHYVDSFAADPFKPFDNLPDERARVLTVRAVLVGLIAGALVNASNVYVACFHGLIIGMIELLTMHPATWV